MGNIVNQGNDGIVYIVYTETMNNRDVDDYVRELTEIAKKSSVKLRILTDTTMMTSMGNEYYKDQVAAAIRPLKSKIEKSAVIGLDTFKRIAARLMFTLSGRHDIKIFNTKEEALVWLKS